MKTRTESKTIALALAAATIFWIAGCDKIGEDAFQGSGGSAPDETIAVSGDQENTVENELVVKGANFDATSNVRLFNAQTGEPVVSGVGETRLVDGTEMRVAIDPSEFPAGEVDVQINKGATIVGSDTVSFIQGPRGPVGPRGLSGKDADLNTLKVDDGVGPNAGSNAVHWSQIFGMPEGFADGDDADTLYVAGDGISIDASDRISLDFGTEAHQAAPGDHAHDDMYYRKDRMDTLLSAKADQSDISLVNDRVLEVAAMVDGLNIDSKADTMYVNAQLGKKADADALAAVEKTAHANGKDIANLKLSVKEHTAALAKIDYTGKADLSYVDAELAKKADADSVKTIAGIANQNAQSISSADTRIEIAETAINGLTLSRSALSEDLTSASDRIETNATAIRTIEADTSYTFRQNSTKISANAAAISELTATVEFAFEDFEDRFSSINYSGKADKTYVDEELAKKSNAADVEESLALKANAADVAEALAAKANAADVEEALAAKANAADVEEALDTKADKTSLATLAETISIYALEFTESLSGKASISFVEEELTKKANSADVAEALAAKANAADVAEALAVKADKTSLTTLAESVSQNTSDIAAIDFSGKADKTYVDSELAKKADASDIENSLALKANAADVSEALDAKADKTSLTTIAESVTKNASDIAAIDFSGKADKTYVDSELAKKADASDIEDALALKANTADIAEALDAKADKIALSTISEDMEYAFLMLDKKANSADVAEALSGKADTSSLATLAEAVTKNTSDIAAIDFSGKADKTYVDAELAKKANASEVEVSLALKANAADIAEALDAKANAADVAESLAAKADISALTTLAESVSKNASDIAAIDFSGKADKTYVDTQLETKADATPCPAKLTRPTWIRNSKRRPMRPPSPAKPTRPTWTRSSRRRLMRQPCPAKLTRPTWTRSSRRRRILLK
ncbi:MAG: hypothetical protein ABIH86_06990 [Planctomycetota bacterium]